MKMFESLFTYFKKDGQKPPQPPNNQEKVVHTKLANGAIFTGQIINGKLEGQGTLAYDNGERYVGEFKNGMKHGKGKYYYIRGELYIGDWFENKKHGRGQYFYESGQRYCGQFCNNMKNGQGILYEADMSEYRGPFFENRKHGQGEYHDKTNNKTYIQIYEYGKLIEEREKLEEQKFNTRDLGAVENAQGEQQNPTMKSLHLDNESWDGLAEGQPTHFSLVYKGLESSASISQRTPRSRQRLPSSNFHSSSFLVVNKKIMNWGAEDVSVWLESFGLVQYVQRFRKENIDGLALLQLNEADLKDDLEVVLGDRKDLLRQIEMLKLIFKNQMAAIFQEVKDIDFSAFTLQNFNDLDGKTQKREEQHKKQVDDGDDDTSESDDEEENENEKQYLQVPDAEQKLKEKKKNRNIEKKVQNYLKTHGIKLNFLIPKDELQILQPIGQGGYGQVFLGRWLGQEVAVKKYIKKNGLRNRHIGHFIEEVQLINRLLHPSIVLYMGMCIYDDQYAIITEFLSNGSLFDYMHKSHNKLSSQRIFYIIKDIALGMTYLHGRKVLHCDLKSSNVLIDENWNVKLCDFGLSRINSNRMTGQARRVGTPHWMAPEILRGQKYEFQSDVYSFGMLLWELLTGEIPYSKYSPAQIIGLVGRDENHQIPDPKSGESDMIELFRMCTKREAKNRPSFKAIVEYLEKCQAKYDLPVDNRVVS